MLCSLCRVLLLLSCCLTLVERGGSCSNCTVAAEKKRTLYLLTLVPYPNSDSFLNPSFNVGDDTQPVFHLAADLINERNDILPNISLKLIHQYDGCDDVLTPLTLASFWSEAYTERGELAGVIGPTCSSSTCALAPVIGRPEIDLVSLHFAASPKFEDRSDYSHLLGLFGSIESFVRGFLYLIDKGDWTRIAVIFDDSREYYRSAAMLLKKKMTEESDVTVEYMISVSRINIPLEEVQSQMLRVVFLMTPVSLARNILCRAYTLNMTSGKYQYVVMSATLDNFMAPVSFYYKGKSHDCSVEDIVENVLNESFLLFYNLLPNLDTQLSAGINYSVYEEKYKIYRENYTLSTKKESSESVYGTLAFDAVWSWALVLDRLTKSSEGFEAQYGNRTNLNRITQEFYRLNFEGMSGSVSYDNKSGFIRREVHIMEVVNFSTCIVASTGPDGEVLHNHIRTCNNTVIFIDDSRSIDRESSELATFFLTITIFEFIVVVVLHIATIKNMRSPSVKASSVSIVNISYIGTYILILGTFVWTLFSAASINIQFRHYFCQVLWAWTIPIGFSLSFSPVLMKTYRLYRIFEHYLDPGPFISSPYLIMSSTVITALYLTISIIWTSLDSFTSETRNHFDRNSSEKVILAVEYYCKCNHIYIWAVSLGLMSLLLLSAGTLLALLTRKIKYSSFATSSLRMLVFLMTIVIILGGSIYAVSELVENQNDRKSHFSFSSLCLLLNTIVGLFIAFVFLPPLLPLIKRRRVVELKTLHQASIFLF